MEALQQYLMVTVFFSFISQPHLSPDSLHIQRDFLSFQETHHSFRSKIPQFETHGRMCVSFPEVASTVFR